MTRKGKFPERKTPKRRGKGNQEGLYKGEGGRKLCGKE